jgi:hypothetical protein
MGEYSLAYFDVDFYFIPHLRGVNLRLVLFKLEENFLFIKYGYQKLILL